MIRINPPIEVSIILPCRNEEQALGLCLDKIRKILDTNQITGEIIVSDSSTDNSPNIALARGACLVKHDQVGYGRAYLESFKVARGQYLIMADADNTYDFGEIPRFLEYLRAGNDLVIGNRFRGKIYPNAMPWLHRYIGTPLLSTIFCLLFGNKIGDINCGLRAISRPALDSLKLKTTGMEFASEMLIKASRQKLKIKEIPINYYPRLGQSKLRSWLDGWRHLKFMVLAANE